MIGVGINLGIGVGAGGAPAAGFTYYVSYSTGDDVTGDGSEANPWQTPAVLPTLNPGESVGFLRGDTWPASALPLTINASGSSAAEADRILFGAYGDEADPKPIFDCETTADRAIDGFGRTFITIQDIKVINQEDISGRHSMRFGNSDLASSRYDVWLIRVETVDTVNGGDDGVYCQQLVDLYVEDCSFTGSENHLAFHPNMAGGATLEAVGCTFTQSGNSVTGTGGSVGGLVATLTDCVFNDCFRAWAGSLTGDSVVLDRCHFISSYNGTTNVRTGAVAGINVTVRYSLIDWTAVTANAQFSNPGDGHTHTLQNCTFLGLQSGTARGQIYANHANGTVNAINCAFVRWNRFGFTTSANENANYCYADGGTWAPDAGGSGNNVTTAGYCDLVTGRPNANLTGANKGTDLGLGALVDFAGDPVNDAAPTRGCYENAA